MSYTGDPHLDAELGRMISEHPDIVADDTTFLAYQQAVLNAGGDFEAAYGQFSQDQATLAIASFEAHEQAVQEARTPAERQAHAVAAHLRHEAKWGQ